MYPDGGPDGTGPIDQIDQQGTQHPAGWQTVEFEVDGRKDQADQQRDGMCIQVGAATQAIEQGATEEELFANARCYAHEQYNMDKGGDAVAVQQTLHHFPIVGSLGLHVGAQSVRPGEVVEEDRQGVDEGNHGGIGQCGNQHEFPVEPTDVEFLTDVEPRAALYRLFADADEPYPSHGGQDEDDVLSPHGEANHGGLDDKRNESNDKDAQKEEHEPDAQGKKEEPKMEPEFHVCMC